jgi:hypothetical protein
MIKVERRPRSMDDLSGALLSVGDAKLGIQAATSIGYDTQALGLMAVAVALAGLDIALTSELGVLWWLPLAGLAVSLAIGVVAISQPEIETGQNLSLVIAMDDDVEAKRQLLLRSVADAIDANTELLAGKRVLVTRATALIGLAFVLLGIAQLAPVAYDLVTRMST